MTSPIESTSTNMPVNPVEPTPPSLPRKRACDECRAKKLRCSKELDGCARCKRQSARCHYSPQKPMGRPRKFYSLSSMASESSANEQIGPLLPNALMADTLSAMQSNNASVNGGTSCTSSPDSGYLNLQMQVPPAVADPNVAMAAPVHWGPVQYGPVRNSTYSIEDSTAQNSAQRCYDSSGQTNLSGTQLANTSCVAYPLTQCQCFHALQACGRPVQTTVSHSVSPVVVFTLFAVAHTIQSTINCPQCSQYSATDMQKLSLIFELLQSLHQTWATIYRSNPASLFEVASVTIQVGEPAEEVARGKYHLRFLRQLIRQAMIGTRENVLRESRSTSANLLGIVEALEEQHNVFTSSHHIYLDGPVSTVPAYTSAAGTRQAVDGRLNLVTRIARDMRYKIASFHFTQEEFAARF
ncbi:hypothetical protein KEM54_001884 [Ascosphaera aggregata]|nr:hypothetical protein KEM54_001884 [Ascosphaera aggregata]